MKKKSAFLSRIGKNIYYYKHHISKYLNKRNRKNTNRPELIEILSHGYCDIFAIAAHQLTGLQLASVHEVRTVGEFTSNIALVHAYLIFPNKKYFFDARGKSNKTTLISEFKIDKTAYLKLHDDCDFLFSLMKESNKDKEKLLKEAKFLIKKFYPELRKYIKVK